MDHSAERPLRDRLTISETDAGRVVIDWAEPGCTTTRLLSARDARTMGEWLIAPAVMTPEDAATFLRIKAKDARSALRTLRKKGLKGIMLSGRILFPLDEVVAFIKRESETNPR